METLIWFNLLNVGAILYMLFWVYPKILSKKPETYEELISKMFIILLGITFSLYLVYVPYARAWTLLDNSTVISGTLPTVETATFGYITFFIQLAVSVLYSFYYLLMKPLGDYEAIVKKDLRNWEEGMKR